jgi:DNA-binding NtrC family response regulator
MGQARAVQPIALVVEDDHDQRALVAMLLEEAEFEVVECESAEAALAVMRLKGDRVAMVFADIRLAGGMDGVELAQILKARFPKLAMIVTSGNPGNRLESLPPSAVYLAKPWLALDLLMRAERAHGAAWLEGRGSRSHALNIPD